MKRLFWVTGASATGKSTLVENFNTSGSNIIALDIDLLRGDDWQKKKDNMLRVVSALDHLSHTKVVFGTVTNKQLALCKSISIFEYVDVLVLTLDEDVLRERLERRGWPTKNIEFQVDLNNSFEERRPWKEGISSSVVNVTKFDEVEQRKCVEDWLCACQK